MASPSTASLIYRIGSSWRQEAAMTTPTRGDTDASSRVGALAALYASERQDGVNGLTAMLAVLAAAATYIAAVLAFGRSIS